MKEVMDANLREATAATAAAELLLEHIAEHRPGGVKRP